MKFEQEDRRLKEKFFKYAKKKYHRSIYQQGYNEWFSYFGPAWDRHKCIRYELYMKERYIFPVKAIRLDIKPEHPKKYWRIGDPLHQPKEIPVKIPEDVVIDEETAKHHRRERVLLMEDLSFQASMMEKFQKSGYRLLDRHLEAIRDCPFYDLIRSTTIVEVWDETINGQAIVRIRRCIAERKRRKMQTADVMLV